jgi:uncharacterized protein (TIGR03492 family)
VAGARQAAVVPVTYNHAHLGWRGNKGEGVRVWFASNGHGEDRSAALIAEQVRAREPRWDILGAPLVGDGSSYLAKTIPVAIRGASMPSGGFSMASASAFLRDLPALAAYPRIVHGLRRVVRPGDRTVVVGDVFALLLARAAIGPVDAFLALAKSNVHMPHSALERRLVHRWGGDVLTRDPETASALRGAGVQARCLGNPLMDDLEPRHPLPPGPPLVALLPGSRPEAVGNLGVLLDIVDHLPPTVAYAVALPAWLTSEAAAGPAGRHGWTTRHDLLQKGGRSVRLYHDRFADVIRASAVVLGMAGTANEQAAGLGHVVVTCIGTGPQSTRSRLRSQERLLGGAAILVDGPPADVADAVSRLLADPSQRAWRGRQGCARMGPPGAAVAIAGAIVERLSGAASRS